MAIIVIVDYGMGNLGSILNMFRRIGASAQISSDADVIRSADKLVLPGVGAFDHAMESLEARGLRSVLDDKVGRRTPLLGICLGMQLLGKSSEEGARPGLGWLDARTVRFSLPPPPAQLKIPHMGWNSISTTRASTLFQGLESGARFYFVHSYHVVCDREADVTARAVHGGAFTAAVQHGHIMGAQFHPEKSHKYGMALLRNFHAAEVFE